MCGACRTARLLVWARRLAAGLGARVALVEARDRLGGDCALFGCVPSKALLHAAKARHVARHADAAGLPGNDVPRVDGKQVMAHVHDTVRHFTDGADSAEHFANLGVDVHLGAPARFEDAHSVRGARCVRVGERVLAAWRVIIATGSRPAVPPIPGIEDVPFLTNESLYEGALEEFPERLLVVGGGPIGVEHAQAFHRLGARVTVVEPQACVLTKEDHEVGCALRRHLVDEGVDVRVDTRLVRLERDGARVRAHVETGEDALHADERPPPTGAHGIEVDAIFLATGRRPNVEGLGLEAAGVTTNRGGIVVDARLRTSARHVYAIGDVTGGLQVTHVADAQAKIAVRNALFPVGRAKWKPDVVPWTTFTDPEVARVGLTADEARERHARVDVHRWEFEDVDRAITDGETNGFLKVVATPRGRILGAHVIGPSAGELIHEFTLAMQHKLSLGDLAQTIHVYPTLSLANRRVGDQYYRTRFERSRGIVHALLRLGGTRPREQVRGRVRATVEPAGEPRGPLAPEELARER